VNFSEDYGDQSEFRLSIPGKPISNCGVQRFWEFATHLRDFGVRISRFDFALDDYDRLLSLEDVVNSCENDNYTGFREYRYFMRKKRGEYDVGRTIYLGSPSSDKMLRIYDKNVESKGETDCIRYEVQWADEKAARVFHSFCSDTLESGYRAATGHALGVCKFLDREVSENLSRCPLLEWWSQFIERCAVAPIRLSMKPLQVLIADKKRWIENQVVPTIALIAKCIGYDSTIQWLENRILYAYNHLSASAKSYAATFTGRVDVARQDYYSNLPVMPISGV
jgi:DNA relaxase NicK